MIIAVNTRLNKETQPEGYESFLFSILNQLAVQFPQHQFLSIFDEPYTGNLVFENNVKSAIAGPKTSSSLRLQYWLNYKLPAVLKKNKVDVFLSMDGTCSLRTSIPQCLILSDLGFLQDGVYKKGLNRFYKKNIPAFLAKAKSLAAVSEPVKKTILDKYSVEAGTVQVIRPVIDPAFKPMHWEEQETVKEKYARGKAYFLCSANNNLINLLKAFTFFKKRQRSSMQLLIAGETDTYFQQEFKLYTLRNEVTLLGDIPPAQLATITAAAYAVIHPLRHDDIALPALQALQCRVPVVAAETASLTALLGAAALYFNLDNFEDIAQKMMQVFKDEDLAKQLVNAGNEIILQYQPHKTAALLMDCILKAANG